MVKDKSLEALKEIRDSFKSYMDDSKYSLENGFGREEVDREYKGYVVARTEYRIYRFAYLLANQKVQDIEETWPTPTPKD